MDMKCSPWQAVVKPFLVPDVERIKEALVGLVTSMSKVQKQYVV